MQAKSQDLYLKTLRDDDTSSSKHGPPGVDKLVFPVLLNGRCVLSEAEGVIAVAAALQCIQVSKVRSVIVCPRAMAIRRCVKAVSEGSDSLASQGPIQVAGDV